MTKEQAAQDIEKLLYDNVGVEVNIDASDLEYGMDVDALERVVDIDRAISEQCEIIYYSRAMEFLEKNDPSLHEAMDCAQEYGYEPKDLSSEILATLLNERQMRNAYYDWRDDIQSILDDIDDPDEDEDIEGCKGVSGVRVDNEWGANEMYLVVMNTESLYNKYYNKIVSMKRNNFTEHNAITSLTHMLQRDIQRGNIYLESGMGRGAEARKMAARDLYNSIP